MWRRGRDRRCSAGIGTRANGLQIERKIAGGLKTLAWILLQTMLDHPRECGSERRVADVQRRRILLEDGIHGLDRGVAAERSAPCEHFVEDDPERENVGAMVGGDTADLLGRHVADRAQHHTVARLHVRECGACGGLRKRGHLTREAEVEHLDASVGDEKHVLGLDIAVDDALVVRRSERAGHLRGDVGGLARRELAAAKPGPQRLAFDQLHDDVALSAVGANVEDVDDVGMIQRANGAGLTLESGERGGIAAQGCWQNLDGDVATEARVTSAIDLAHPARADHRHDFVRAE